VKGFVRNRGGTKQPNGSYRGGTWTAYWEEPRSADGRRRQGSKGGFPTKRAAQDYLASVLGAKQAGSYVPPAKLTFGRYLTESWLPMQRQRLRESSFDDYRRRIEAHILPTLGGVGLQELDAARLDRLYADLLASGGPSGRALAPKTVRNVHAVIRKALADATRKRLVTRNVAIDADPPKVPGPGEREMATWTPDELRAFLEAIASHRLAAAYVLAASTGMRRGEVLGLRWCDIDLVGGTISIRQTVVNVAYQVKLSEPKTARGRRTISLDPATAAVLRRHRDLQAEEKLSVGEGYEDHGLAFARQDGRPVHPDYFSQTFDRTVKRLGLRRVRLHDLRHTYATLALRAGVDAKTVSARLGHATVAFTLDVYTKAVPQLDREAASKVAELIFGGEG
jgi:integrase